MKSITALAVLCALTVPVSSVAAEGPPRQGTGSGVLRVAAEPDTPPMLTREGNRYDGFDWAIANAVAKKIGFDRVEIVAGKYSELPGRLIAGQADVIISGYTADPSIEGVTGRTPTSTMVYV